MSSEDITGWTHFDASLFGCCTGVSYADVVSITEDNICNGEDGSKWLKYNRQKNGHRASVKLLPEALALIDKYHDGSGKTAPDIL